MNPPAAISADLLTALTGHKALSQALYDTVLMDYETELQASLDSDADDALLCMLAEEGEVAMLLIDWNGHVHRNADALRQLQAMWSHSFDANIQVLVPVLSEYIRHNHLGVAGIKWSKALRAPTTGVGVSRNWTRCCRMQGDLALPRSALLHKSTDIALICS